jgi:FkbM family methyltransferase
MKVHYPLLAQAAKSMGVYAPLHRVWIGICARRTGCGVRLNLNGTFDLARHHRVIRYRNWDMAFFLAANFDYYFSAVQSVRVGDEELVDFSHPGWHRLLHSKELFFFNDLAEPEDTTDLYCSKANLRAGDTVLDMGAYNGTQTVFFGRMVGPSGRVYAFEPDPQSLHALRTNLDFHQASNVEVVPKGVWSSSGSLSFSSDGSMGSSLVEEHIHAGQVIRVPVVHPGDFAAEHRLDRIDFIKMDIEGAELEVVRSMGPLLERFRPRLILEAHEVGGQSLVEPVRRAFDGFGYRTELVPQRVSGSSAELPLVYAEPNRST